MNAHRRWTHTGESRKMPPTRFRRLVASLACHSRQEGHRNGQTIAVPFRLRADRPTGKCRRPAPGRVTDAGRCPPQQGRRDRQRRGDEAAATGGGAGRRAYSGAHVGECVGERRGAASPSGSDAPGAQRGGHCQCSRAPTGGTRPSRCRDGGFAERHRQRGRASARCSRRPVPCQRRRGPTPATPVAPVPGVRVGQRDREPARAARPGGWPATAGTGTGGVRRVPRRAGSGAVVVGRFIVRGGQRHAIGSVGRPGSVLAYR
jgi:hypothetical protein